MGTGCTWVAKRKHSGGAGLRRRELQVRHRAVHRLRREGVRLVRHVGQDLKHVDRLGGQRGDDSG